MKDEEKIKLFTPGKMFRVNNLIQVVEYVTDKNMVAGKYGEFAVSICELLPNEDQCHD